MCENFEPLYKLLCVVDTNVYPIMEAVYELMRIVGEELRKKNGTKWVLNIINDKWDRILSHPLHVTSIN